jgi:hypothetical protein
VIEALAKRIGYNKVRSFTLAADPHLLKDFIDKTGFTVHIYVSPEPFKSNNVTAVPVTIIETKDGKKLRFDGFTENFGGQEANGQPQGQVLPGATGGAQCGSK